MTGSSYEEGLCEHHTVHDKDCGYEPADEGHPCSHVKDGEHDKSCYELICGYKEGELEEADASDSDAPKPHEHDDSCYELDCPHLDGKHDEACGYEAPTEGQTCGFTCEICGKDDEAGGGQDEDAEASNPQNEIDDPASGEIDTDKGENADGQEDKGGSCICEIRCTEDSINEDCPVCSAEDAELEMVCLGETSIKRTPKANEDYVVETSGDTTTYEFHTFPDSWKAYYISFSQTTNELVLDFTKLADDVETSINIQINPYKAGNKISIIGEEGRDYPINFIIQDYPEYPPVDIYLKNFSTDKSLKLTADGESSITYSGDCSIYQLISEGEFSGQKLEITAADASELHIGYLSGSSSEEHNKLTLRKGSFVIGNGIENDSVLIDNADVTFDTDAKNGEHNIEAKKIEISNSYLYNVGNICSYEQWTSSNNADYVGSEISIKDSELSFDAKVDTHIYTSSVLGNAETITIERSKISGIEISSNYGCIGGFFDELIISDSEIHAKGEKAPAIGPSKYALDNIKSFDISISDSKVEAVSKYGAGIGLPFLEYSSSGNKPSEVPELKITISGDSEVTATSVYSAAIGGAKWSMPSTSVDDGRIEIEFGAGIGGWNDGGSSDADAGLDASIMSRSRRSARNFISAEDMKKSIADAAYLYENVSLTINDSPYIEAKSGVLAVYTENIVCDETNLVQNTMVRTSPGSSNYILYAAEAPGAVTIGDESLGEIGYGYASVAKTNVGEHTDESMWFGNSELTDVTNGEKEFSTESSGFKEFFTTPELEIYGAVQLIDDSDNPINGSANIGDELKADVSGLYPESARNLKGHIVYQWYSNGSPIEGETGVTYDTKTDDDGKVLYCVVSGTGGYAGSVISNAVIITQAASGIDAPELKTRTEDSITLVHKEGFEYSIDYGANWQESNIFTGLEKGKTYTFIQKDGNGTISSAESFATLSDKPDIKEFSFDYVEEELKFPAGVDLYKDENCTTGLNQYSSSLHIDISGYISDHGAAQQKLYARYSADSSLDAVTEITVPSRPAPVVLSEDEIFKTSDKISILGADGVNYRLKDENGNIISGPVLGDGSSLEFGGLIAGNKYSLEMRREASNALPDPHFYSETSVLEFTLPAEDAMEGTILVPSGVTGTYEYDLNQWIGETSITSAYESNDADDIIEDLKFDGTKLILDAASVLDSMTATINVVAGSGKAIELTVETVNVVADGGEGIWWVRPFDPSNISIAGDPSEDDVSNALNQMAASLGYDAQGKESFGLEPLYAVGGNVAADAENADIQWKPAQSASVSFDSGSFLVLYIPRTGLQYIRQLDYKRGVDGLTFSTEGSGGRYMVLYREASESLMTADVKLDGVSCNEFELGDILTVDFSAKAADSSSTLIPTGSVSLYLGDPQNGGRMLASYELNASDGGRGSITYTIAKEDILHGKQQKLYLVYDGNYDLLPVSIAEDVVFNALVPDEPVVSATASEGSAHISWTVPEDNGSAITYYQLAVYHGTDELDGSPFNISGAVTSYDLTGLTGGTTYTFVLRAYNEAGPSGSRTVSLTVPEVAHEPEKEPDHPESAGVSGSGGSVSGPIGVYYEDGRHIPGNPQNGTWRQDDKGWWFELYDGSWPKACWYQCWWNGEIHWYHFNAEGYADGGWFTDTDGNIYYLHPYHDGDFGYMYTGDHVIDGTAYSFSKGREQDGLPEGALKR